MNKTLQTASVVGSLVAAAFLLVVLVAMYLPMLRGEAAPPGHPWSGISESLLVVMLVSQAIRLRTGSRPAMWTGLTASLLVLLSAVMWFLSRR